MTPIDEDQMPPPPIGVDVDYLTQDLDSALYRAVLDLVDDAAKKQGVGRRRAALIVIQRLRGMRSNG